MKRKRSIFRSRLGAALFVFLLLPDTGANFSLRLPVHDVEAELFLGEHVRLSTAEGSVERQMIGLSDEEYLRLSEGYTVSTRWETKDGTPIGEGKELQKLTPAESKAYRLRISISSKPGEVHSLSPTVPLIEYEALYRVQVKSGTITVRVNTEQKKLPEGEELRFIARKESGETFFCSTTPETDPETGASFLFGAFSGLPYGVYTVSPAGEAEKLCVEQSKICSLGVWGRDDTVSVHRANAAAVFTFN